MAAKFDGKAKFGLSVFLLMCLAFGGCISVKCNGGLMPDYSTGSRTGKLVKLSKKGVVWKSWEGQLLLADFAFRRPNSEANNNVWEFSCTSDSLGEELTKLEGQHVTIHYRQYLIGPVQQGTGYTATKVELATKE